MPATDNMNISSAGRRVGLTLRRAAVGLVAIQLLVACLLLARSGRVRGLFSSGIGGSHAAGKPSLWAAALVQSAQEEDGAEANAVASGLAAKGSQSTLANPGRRERGGSASPQQGKQQRVQQRGEKQQQGQQQQSQQQQGQQQLGQQPVHLQGPHSFADAGAVPHVGRAKAAAAMGAAASGVKAAAASGQAAQQHAQGAGGMAAAGAATSGKQAGNAVRHAAAGSTSAPSAKKTATVVGAASGPGGSASAAAAAAGKAAGGSAAAFPPFAKPVVPYASRVANPPSIVGVVFYGRRDRVRILDCYLQRNLVRHGGLLRQVVFVSATWQREDVDFLDRLVRQRAPDYRKLIPERLDRGYTGHYAWMDPRQLYVKIDDDVVFIADDAVDHMLAAHMLHRYHLISANVVNHQPLELPHSQSGAHTTYVQTTPGDKSSWRPLMRQPAAAAGAQAQTQAQTQAQAHAVPFTDNGWDTWGDWRKAANVHYSFLANQAAGRLSVYQFPKGEDPWDFNAHFGYTRWRINMIMFQGSTIDVHVYNMSSTTGTYPGDDEDFITRILPQQLNRTSAAASRALAVHFSFYPQRAGLENSTDLLDRYARLAEKTCGRLVSAAYATMAVEAPVRWSSYGRHVRK